MLYRLARPWLFALDPEHAHHRTLHALERAHRLGIAQFLSTRLPDDPVHAMGLTFRNPVGLAAGLDKNAAHIDALADLGFGFIEVGTVTPQPQPGNPQPRMFRLVPAQALINRLGFNNEGVAAFVNHITRQHTFSNVGGIIGLNIGKNAVTPMERALDDYVAGLTAVYPLAATRACYVTVNISSPNTKNLRELQSGHEFITLLHGLAQARKRLADQYGRYLPIAIKIAPDLEDSALPYMADLMVEHGMDAIVATNTTLARDAVQGLAHAQENGGLSGAPVFQRSTEVVRQLAQHLQGRLPIIAVGGILSGEDAVKKFEAGATLVQLYTGLIYRGPQLVSEARQALLQWRTPPA